MITYSDMLLKAQDNKPHNFTFVAKGDNRRRGGYLVTMEETVVSSSFHEASTFNLLSINSSNVRKVYSILIIEFDGHKVVY